MRFAWLRKKRADAVPGNEGITHRLILVAYNLVWWLPVVLPLARVIDYRAGFTLFLAITLVRAAVNLIRNNVLTPEQGEFFPLRSP